MKKKTQSDLQKNPDYLIENLLFAWFTISSEETFNSNKNQQNMKVRKDFLCIQVFSVPGSYKGSQNSSISHQTPCAFSLEGRTGLYIVNAKCIRVVIKGCWLVSF